MVALIHVAGGAIGLPKGHLDDGESDPEAALREVAEETGLRCRLHELLGETAYSFRGRRGVLVNKTVAFYLMTYRAGSPAHHDHEVESVSLVPLEAAAGALTYPGEKEIIAATISRLVRSPGGGFTPAHTLSEF